jgi:hypothetical protein
LRKGACFMTKTKAPQDTPEENDQLDELEEDPGLEPTVATTEEGDTPIDERYRRTGQSSGSDVRPGAAPEAPGAAKKPGSPTQTGSR